MDKKITIIQKILEHPLVDTIAKFIKKFKSSKSYWSVSFLVIVFTFREAVAWKYGSAISKYAQEQLEGSDYSWWWTLIEFIFDFGGSWELALGGFLIFIILSLVKVSEGENNTVTLRESFLSLLLLVTLLGMGIYGISNNDKNHQETHKQQKITHDKLDEIKALIKLQGGDEKYFLEKYFGKDYAIILNHPQTYHNFTTLLKQTNKTAAELLKEREELLNKIKSQSFSPKLQAQIDKAFKKLRYEDARELLDAFLELNSGKEKELIKAHYMKALSYIEQKYYNSAEKEFETYIPISVKSVQILYDFAFVYEKLKKYSNALIIYKNIIKKNTIQRNKYIMAHCYTKIGFYLYKLEKYSQSLEYHKKVLNILLHNLPPLNGYYTDTLHNFNLVKEFEILALVSFKNKNFNMGYYYLQKAIKYEKLLPVINSEKNKKYLKKIQSYIKKRV